MDENDLKSIWKGTALRIGPLFTCGIVSIDLWPLCVQVYCLCGRKYFPGCRTSNFGVEVLNSYCIAKPVLSLI
jgi:hypothetical protein